jgi:hypothetical protein
MKFVELSPSHLRYPELTGERSTWRSLVPELEDRPLALCQSRSIDPHDLVPADRIIPDRVGEVYYLTYNLNHRWYVMPWSSDFIGSLVLRYEGEAKHDADKCDVAV